MVTASYYLIRIIESYQENNGLIWLVSAVLPLDVCPRVSLPLEHCLLVTFSPSSVLLPIHVSDEYAKFIALP
jgi:hypothetical protein